MTNSVLRNQPLISVVVVAYNIVEYLGKAIDSVIQQWDSDWELVVVNDGSTDGTYSLLEEYKNKIESDRFVVIHQDNGGVSVARNSGVRAANGQYIAFLDGDDFFDINHIKLIRNILFENQPDCLVIDFNYYHSGDSSPNSSHNYFLERKLLQNSEDNTHFLVNLYKGSQLYPWKYILKKSILSRYSYPIGRTYEDVSVLPLQMLDCKTLYYIPASFIQYRQRSGSIMKVKSRHNILCLSSSLSDVTDELRKRYDDIPYELSVEHSVFNLYLFTWACGDTLANKDLEPREIYNYFVSNFNYSNLVSLNELKLAMRRDKKNWRKFIMFYKLPELFYLAHYMKHRFNLIYRILNKCRELIYKT